MSGSKDPLLPFGVQRQPLRYLHKSLNKLLFNSTFRPIWFVFNTVQDDMLTIADAIEAITGFRPQTTTVITEAVIDSRQTIPGSLFVAIPGENVDGHDFIGEAFKRGASFALIQRDGDASFRILELVTVHTAGS